MSELADKLTAAGQQHHGTEFGGLLQWAALHIADQDEALAELRIELETEQAERLRLERAIHTARQAISEVDAGLRGDLPINIALAKDHAPHINVMAHHGVMPYAKTPGKPKAAA